MGSGSLAADGAWTALGGVVVQNNTWGRGDLRNGRDYVQTVTYGESVADGIRFEWDWPRADPRRVLAYPSLWSGEKPFNGAAAGDLLPARLGAIESLTLDLSLDWGGAPGGFNVALDLWLSEDPEGGRDAIAQEVMVWLKPAEFRPGGSDAGEVRLGGLDYAVKLREPGGATAWGFAAYQASAPVREGRIDLGAVLDHLRAAGAIADDLHLMDVELGAEVIGGRGWLEVTRFDLRAEIADAASAPPRPLAGGPGGDALRGGAAADLLAGRDGDDALAGGAGADILRGGAGRDLARGQGGDDRLEGGRDDDRLFGGAGDDRLAGGGGADRAFGGPGSDRLHGGSGGDALRGGGGADAAQGAAGRDRLAGGGGDDRLAGGAGNDRVAGNAGNDVLAGDGGRDALIGGPGADALSGGAGADRLRGGGGADRLDGGPGSDALAGGPGADAFVFAPGGGRDRVAGFEPGTDAIDLTAFDLAEPPSLRVAPGGAALTLDGASVLLLGLEADALGPGDFLL